SADEPSEYRGADDRGGERARADSRGVGGIVRYRDRVAEYGLPGRAAFSQRHRAGRRRAYRMAVGARAESRTLFSAHRAEAVGEGIARSWRHQRDRAARQIAGARVGTREEYHGEADAGRALCAGGADAAAQEADARESGL